MKYCLHNIPTRYKDRSFTLSIEVDIFCSIAVLEIYLKYKLLYYKTSKVRGCVRKLNYLLFTKVFWS